MLGLEVDGIYLGAKIDPTKGRELHKISGVPLSIDDNQNPELRGLSLATMGNPQYTLNHPTMIGQINLHHDDLQGKL